MEASDARTADLDALSDALTLHPEPPDIAEEIESLRARGGGLTDEAFLVELMRLTAMRDADGHTGIFPLAQPGMELWPVRLYPFEEGWRVIDARAPHEELVGEEVTAVGGLPIADVAARVLPLVPHDTDASALGRLPQHIIAVPVLRGLGIEPVLELGGRTVDLPPITAEAYAEWAGLPYPLICPPLIDPDEPVWAVEVRPDAVVLRYRRVLASEGTRRVAELAAEVAEAAAQAAAGAIVLDVRDNPGGDTGTARVLVDQLAQLDAEQPGRLRILVNRCTFSAATNVVVQLLESTEAPVVGEVMGGSPTMWGDARPHTLPSGIVVHVASRTWELGGPDAPASVVPDVAVPVRWTDHLAGADPALDAAIGAG